jgi:hypothetical protein
MSLGSTQPLVKMSTRDVPGGKVGQCVRLTTYHHIVPMSRNLGAVTLLDPSGPAWPVMGVLYLLSIYTFRHTRLHPTYSGLVPPSIHQLWYSEAPVDCRTTMSSESVWQVARSWVDGRSVHTFLFGVVCFAIDSVREFLDTPSYAHLCVLMCYIHIVFIRNYFLF